MTLLSRFSDATVELILIVGGHRETISHGLKHGAYIILKTIINGFMWNLLYERELE